MSRDSTHKVRLPSHDIRRPFALLMVLLITIGFTVSAARAAVTSESPNILLIMVEDLNDYVGVLGGHPQARTPNIDALAAEGILFSNAHVASPSCNASRASLMTGISPGRSGIVNNATTPMRAYLPRAVSLNRAFKDAGYYVAGYGKMFHGNQEPADWDHYDDKFRGTPTGSGLFRPRLNGLNLESRFDWGPLDTQPSAMDDYKNASEVIDFLDSRNAEDPQPFFLAIGFHRTHLPWYCPRYYHDLIAGGDTQNIILPPVNDNDLDDIGPIATRWVTQAFGSQDHEKITNAGLVASAVHSYLACGAFVDDQVGRILDTLDQSPMKDDTIVAFVSDHGWHLGEKFTWRKFKLWEEDTRVPFIIRLPGGPGTPTERNISRPVNAAALYPTLLDLAGVPLPDYDPGDSLYRVDYRSLVPLLRNTGARWAGPAITFNETSNISLRTERYRFTLYNDGFSELYDHGADPNEWHNLAALPAYQDQVTRWTADARRYLAGNYAPLGYPDTAGTARLGDLVWSDIDGDGIQDPAEPGKAGVTVRLTDCDAVVMATTTTGNNGQYLFDRLAAGHYRIEFAPGPNTVLSPPLQGTKRGRDSNPNPATGFSSCLTMTDGQSRTGIDAGVVEQAGGAGGIGDRVWDDLNADGIQDPGEPGLGGVTAQLLDCDGNPSTAVVSGANGGYLFSGLAAGRYRIGFTPPAGRALGPRAQGRKRGKDSNPDPTTGLTSCIPMADGQVRLGIDASVIVPHGGG